MFSLLNYMYTIYALTDWILNCGATAKSLQYRLVIGVNIHIHHLLRIILNFYSLLLMKTWSTVLSCLKCSIFTCHLSHGWGWFIPLNWRRLPEKLLIPNLSHYERIFFKHLTNFAVTIHAIVPITIFDVGSGIYKSI